MTENKLNRLERSIQNAEESAEDARWMQAEEVVRRLDANETQADIAASWMNLNRKPSRPYTQQHVSYCAKAWRTSALVRPRPLWKDAYMAAGGRPDRWAPTRESQAPTSVATARKLVDNVMKSAPAEVQDTLYHELKLARAGEDRSPAARKAATAAASAAVAPLRQAVASSQTALTIQAVREAAEGVRELIEDGAATSAWMKRMDAAINDLLEAVAEARFGLGVDA